MSSSTVPASQTTSGIVETFGNDDGRQAHLSGEVAEALGQVADDLLAEAPDLHPVDILGSEGA